MEGLLEEMNRNRELLVQYAAIGPAGTLGAVLISQDIATAERAIADDDVVAMLRVYEALKNNE